VVQVVEYLHWKHETLSSNSSPIKINMTGRVFQIVECLPSKYEDLTSKPRTEKNIIKVKILIINCYLNMLSLQNSPSYMQVSLPHANYKILEGKEWDLIHFTTQDTTEMSLVYGRHQKMLWRKECIKYRNSNWFSCELPIKAFFESKIFVYKFS
jgi:hypothetical protein